MTTGRAVGGPADGMILEFPSDSTYVAVVEGEAMVLPDPSDIRRLRTALSAAWAARVRWELYVYEPLTVVPFLPHWSHRARLPIEEA